MNYSSTNNPPTQTPLYAVPVSAVVGMSLREALRGALSRTEVAHLMRQISISLIFSFSSSSFFLPSPIPHSVELLIQ